ncbi:hypothetical protein MAR_014560 [Mya arenaria]|uniref:Uncharacterized protein n=1 Tax=Mya arenaria TaxID=6604 RepID=A0ABY7GCC2_MYAAR|nr:hypothetical protein MAR_014560 [Mya arenaria]
MGADMLRMQDRLTELENNVAALLRGGIAETITFVIACRQVTNVGRAYNAHDGAFVVPVNGTI